MEMLTMCLSWAILLPWTGTSSNNFLPYNIRQKFPLFIRTVGKCRVTDTVRNKVKWRLPAAGSLHFAHCSFPKDTVCAGWATPRNRHICCSGSEACQIPAARDSPGEFYFLPEAFISPECHVSSWQWECAHPAKKCVLGLGSAVGLLGQGYLRNRDHVITVPPSIAPTLEIQTTTSFSHMEWLTNIDARVGKKVVNMLQN